jgi:hypothetical protein
MSIFFVALINDWDQILCTNPFYSCGFSGKGDFHTIIGSCTVIPYPICDAKHSSFGVFMMPWNPSNFFGRDLAQTVANHKVGASTERVICCAREVYPHISRIEGERTCSPNPGESKVCMSFSCNRSPARYLELQQLQSRFDIDWSVATAFKE